MARELFYVSTYLLRDLGIDHSAPGVFVAALGLPFLLNYGELRIRYSQVFRLEQTVRSFRLFQELT